MASSSHWPQPLLTGQGKIKNYEEVCFINIQARKQSNYQLTFPVCFARSLTRISLFMITYKSRPISLKHIFTQIQITIRDLYMERKCIFTHIQIEVYTSILVTWIDMTPLVSISNIASYGLISGITIYIFNKSSEVLFQLVQILERG